MIPPDLFNMQAEQAVISAALRSADTLDLVGLAPMDFVLATHQQIARAIQHGRSRQHPHSVQAIADCLRAQGHLDAVGGMPALLALLSDHWQPSHEVEAAARIVQHLAVRRDLVAAAGTIARLGYDLQGDLEQQIGDATQALTVSTRRLVAGSTAPLSDALPGWFAMITSDETAGVRTLTGLADVDRITGGLWAGDVTVLAAATSVGKTALALTIADAATQDGTPVLWISLEMPRTQLINRLVAMHTGLDAHRLRMRQITPGQLPAISQAMAALDQQPLLVEDTPTRTLAQIRQTCHQQQARYGQLGLVVIDHLGLIQASGRYVGQRVHEMGELSRGCKALAMELHAPLLVLHQFSRAGAADRTPDHVPVLSDLRDSGNVEQDADNVWLLHRPGKTHTTTLYLAKHRNGPLAQIPLWYHATTTRFRNATDRTEVPYAA